MQFFKPVARRTGDTLPAVVGANAALGLGPRNPPLVKVRWYFCAPTAKPFPGGSIWGSALYLNADERTEATYGVDPFAPTKWTNGATPRGAAGLSYCGELSDFREPATYDPNLPPLKRVGDLPVCCARGVNAALVLTAGPTPPHVCYDVAFGFPSLLVESDKATASPGTSAGNLFSTPKAYPQTYFLRGTVGTAFFSGVGFQFRLDIPGLTWLSFQALIGIAPLTSDIALLDENANVLAFQTFGGASAGDQFVVEIHDDGNTVSGNLLVNGSSVASFSVATSHAATNPADCYFSMANFVSGLTFDLLQVDNAHGTTWKDTFTDPDGTLLTDHQPDEGC